ncbi:hypothetical protein FGO68_gene10720 [Halteria grandinella]|uniref:Uncharacterized protein n=1 Tax=Halteria grandinella TaxID=5974 RepID=A0A8J8P6I6_HALGN|nr:hypothetical protein FGO68_gene10720 [Halteria grandinella]
MNHLQVLSLVGSFDFNWPESIIAFYKGIQPVSDAQSQIISVDCFLENQGNRVLSTEEEANIIQRPFYVKSMILGVLPLLMVVLSLVVWLTIDAVKKYRGNGSSNTSETLTSQQSTIGKREEEGNFTDRFKDRILDSMKLQALSKNQKEEKKNLRGKITSTMIVILFLIHPTLTREMLNLFNCKNIEGTERLFKDLQVVCYEGKHSLVAFGVALPCIIIYSIGIPLMGFWVIYKNRTKLDQAQIKQRYGFLYNGYKMGIPCYWEIFIIYRKVIIIFISVFLVQNGKIVQALVTLMFLLLMLSLIMFLSPYNRPYLNKLEFLSLFSSAVSVYFCLYFISDSLADPSQLKYDNAAANSLMFALIIVMQGAFFAYWGHCFNREFQATIRARYPRVYLVVCCREARFRREREVEEYKDKVLAPITAKIAGIIDYFEEKKRLYQNGLIPQEDKELREQVIKLSHYQQRIESQLKFDSNKPKFTRVEMMLHNARSDGLEGYEDSFAQNSTKREDISASFIAEDEVNSLTGGRLKERGAESIWSKSRLQLKENKKAMKQSTEGLKDFKKIKIKKKQEFAKVNDLKTVAIGAIGSQANLSFKQQNNQEQLEFSQQVGRISFNDSVKIMEDISNNSLIEGIFGNTLDQESFGVTPHGNSINEAFSPTSPSKQMRTAELNVYRRRINHATNKRKRMRDLINSIDRTKLRAALKMRRNSLIPLQSRVSGIIEGSEKQQIELQITEQEESVDEKEQISEEGSSVNEMEENNSDIAKT